MENNGFNPRYIAAVYGIVNGIITLRTNNFTVEYKRDQYSLNYYIEF